ncbi:hypothetical protein PACTADRAFT_50615 [Pachysolen tannophilus NRRL Y-2460]|uniref:Uncharacterized protein n=1 Tax=Pachysolen tannophilus NRRL Y-2460 TaxID=669874 RepID=A0A1E4TSL9_PACTA|nr:hypothetical protein PACTADRAFT_50615 [Pachysolen tannophilus NRRL Y-2460]
MKNFSSLGHINRKLTPGLNQTGKVKRVSPAISECCNKFVPQFMKDFNFGGVIAETNIPVF